MESSLHPFTDSRPRPGPTPTGFAAGLPHALAVSRHFNAGAESVPSARVFLADALTAFPEELVLIAQLLASEVVTNAVLHARTPLLVSIELDTPRLRISVEDGSAQLPLQRARPDDAVDGRGLLLVDSLASAWGCDPTDRGKRVWFELPALGVRFE